LGNGHGRNAKDIEWRAANRPNEAKKRELPTSNRRDLAGQVESETEPVARPNRPATFHHRRRARAGIARRRTCHTAALYLSLATNAMPCSGFVAIAAAFAPSLAPPLPAASAPIAETTIAAADERKRWSNRSAAAKESHAQNQSRYRNKPRMRVAKISERIERNASGGIDHGLDSPPQTVPPLPTPRRRARRAVETQMPARQRYYRTVDPRYARWLVYVQGTATSIRSCAARLCRVWPGGIGHAARWRWW